MAVFTRFVVASLRNMSICARVVVAVAFKQIDDAPTAETRANSDHDDLERVDCGNEKCHSFFAAKIAALFCTARL